VLLHHCPGGDCHTHPFIKESGTSGSFTAPDHGDETYFEIILTATDSGGKKDTASVEIHPQTVQVTLDTSPTGLQVVYGGEAGTAPLTRTAIVGSTHTIYTPSPQGDFEFESWSDGGAAQHNVRVGATDATYTATFKDITPPTVRATNPKARATGVRRGTNITATFNKAMDPVTLVTTPTNPSNPNVGTSTTFTLTRAEYTMPVPAVVTLSADGKTVWLNPTNRLRARTWYRVKIIGAKDLAGNTLPNKAWSFKTRS
jgi:hypothetical protein